MCKVHSTVYTVYTQCTQCTVQFTMHSAQCLCVCSGYWGSFWSKSYTESDYFRNPPLSVWPILESCKCALFSYKGTRPESPVDNIFSSQVIWHISVISDLPLTLLNQIYKMKLPKESLRNDIGFFDCLVSPSFFLFPNISSIVGPALFEVQLNQLRK